MRAKRVSGTVNGAETEGEKQGLLHLALGPSPSPFTNCSKPHSQPVT